MTEDQWVLTSDRDMIGVVFALGQRRGRLLASAVCRVLGRWVDHLDTLTALDVNDRYADTGKTKVGLRRSRQSVRAVRHRLLEQRPEDAVYPQPHWRALWAVEMACSENAVSGAIIEAAAVLQDVEDLGDHAARRRLYPIYKDFGGTPGYYPGAPTWRTTSALALARTMYDARDFAALPILADALEEAGCDDPHILAHCRDPNLTHVRGCWVVDLVLGKS